MAKSPGNQTYPCDVMSDPIVSPNWLSSHISSVIVADVRSYLDGRLGLDAYQTGHISGAIFIDLNDDLASFDPSQPTLGRHPLPTPQRFAAAMGNRGISHSDTIVAYDDMGGAMAARLVWMWRALGREAFLLDGGIQAWSGDLSVDAASRPICECDVAPWPQNQVIDADGAASLAAEGHLLDARVESRFLGHANPIDARLGHIPGARNAPWHGNLDPTTNRFLDAETLRGRYRALGVRNGQRTGVSCGSGVTACHDLLAMQRAGFSGGVLYSASWSGWTVDPDRPVEMGN